MKLIQTAYGGFLRQVVSLRSYAKTGAQLGARGFGREGGALVPQKNITVFFLTSKTALYWSVARLLGCDACYWKNGHMLSSSTSPVATISAAWRSWEPEEHLSEVWEVPREFQLRVQDLHKTHFPGSFFSPQWLRFGMSLAARVHFLV